MHRVNVETIFLFSSSVCFDSFKNLILSSLARDWCSFPSRRLPCTSICLSIFVFLRSMFAFIPPFVDFVRYLQLSDILAQHDSNTVYRGSRKKSVDYFVRSIYRYGIDQALFHQLKVFG